MSTDLNDFIYNTGSCNRPEDLEYILKLVAATEKTSTCKKGLASGKISLTPTEEVQMQGLEYIPNVRTISNIPEAKKEEARIKELIPNFQKEYKDLINRYSIPSRLLKLNAKTRSDFLNNWSKDVYGGYKMDKGKQFYQALKALLNDQRYIDISPTSAVSSVAFPILNAKYLVSVLSYLFEEPLETFQRDYEENLKTLKSFIMKYKKDVFLRSNDGEDSDFDDSSSVASSEASVEVVSYDARAALEQIFKFAYEEDERNIFANYHKPRSDFIASKLGTRGQPSVLDITSAQSLADSKGQPVTLIEYFEIKLPREYNSAKKYLLTEYIKNKHPELLTDYKEKTGQDYERDEKKRRDESVKVINQQLSESAAWTAKDRIHQERLRQEDIQKNLTARSKNKEQQITTREKSDEQQLTSVKKLQNQSTIQQQRKLTEKDHRAAEKAATSTNRERAWNQYYLGRRAKQEAYKERQMEKAEKSKYERDVNQQARRSEEPKMVKTAQDILNLKGRKQLARYQTTTAKSEGTRSRTILREDGKTNKLYNKELRDAAGDRAMTVRAQDRSLTDVANTMQLGERMRTPEKVKAFAEANADTEMSRNLSIEQSNLQQQLRQTARQKGLTKVQKGAVDVLSGTSTAIGSAAVGLGDAVRYGADAITGAADRQRRQNKQKETASWAADNMGAAQARAQTMVATEQEKQVKAEAKLEAARAEAQRKQLNLQQGRPDGTQNPISTRSLDLTARDSPSTPRPPPPPPPSPRASPPSSLRDSSSQGSSSSLLEEDSNPQKIKGTLRDFGAAVGRQFSKLPIKRSARNNSSARNNTEMQQLEGMARARREEGDRPPPSADDDEDEEPGSNPQLGVRGAVPSTTLGGGGSRRHKKYKRKTLKYKNRVRKLSKKIKKVRKNTRKRIKFLHNNRKNNSRKYNNKYHHIRKTRRRR